MHRRAIPPAPSDELTAQWARTPPGQVRTWFCTNVFDTLARLEGALALQPATHLLALGWARAPGVDGAIAGIVGALAGVAAARWPGWYGEADAFSHDGHGGGIASAHDERVIHRMATAWPRLNPAWARLAVHRCRAGDRPLPPGFTNQVHAQQLSLAIAPAKLFLALALEAPQPHAANLLCFARAAAWAARETGMPVAAFVPMAHRHAAELDAITYGAFQDTPATVDAGTPGPPDEPPRVTLPFITGQPHPASPGELRLAQCLSRDPELAPLFQFNQPIEPTGGGIFIADLLWAAGKLVVEVDGYGWHSSPHAFSSDRYRDYRLLCDGYRTLRLPHDDVMDDPALQCEKIRDIVHSIQRGDGR
jgi:hypothetical protein